VHCESFIQGSRQVTITNVRYEHADGLVGVYRENEENTSKTLSLDLRKVSHDALVQYSVADGQYVE
jgi:hypothetical protein